MTDMPMVIEERPKGVRGWLGQLLKGRRVLSAAILAVAEIVAIVVWGPGLLLSVAGAIIVMVLAVMLATRIKAGFGRDVLWVVGGAQAMIVAPIVVVGASLFLGIIVAGIIIAGLLVLAFRMKA